MQRPHARGGSTTEAGAACAADDHANATGYRVIAQAVLDALACGR